MFTGVPEGFGEESGRGGKTESGAEGSTDDDGPTTSSRTDGDGAAPACSCRNSHPPLHCDADHDPPGKNRRCDVSQSVFFKDEEDDRTSNCSSTVCDIVDEQLDVRCQAQGTTTLRRSARFSLASLASFWMRPSLHKSATSASRFSISSLRRGFSFRPSVVYDVAAEAQIKEDSDAAARTRSLNKKVLALCDKIVKDHEEPLNMKRAYLRLFCPLVLVPWVIVTLLMVFRNVDSCALDKAAIHRVVIASAGDGLVDEGSCKIAASTSVPPVAGTAAEATAGVASMAGVLDGDFLIRIPTPFVDIRWFWFGRNLLWGAMGLCGNFMFCVHLYSKNSFITMCIFWLLCAIAFTVIIDTRTIVDGSDEQEDVSGTCGKLTDPLYLATGLTILAWAASTFEGWSAHNLLNFRDAPTSPVLGQSGRRSSGSF